MQSSHEKAQCVYCGATEELTKEHAPPQLLFPPPRPRDLITVPACLTCNQAGSKDAEYFRLSLCLNPQTKDAADVIAFKPAVRRSLEYPQAERDRNAIISALQPAGDKIVFTVDLKRIHSVLERTVQCLYLHETGRRLPQTHEATAFSDEFLAQLGSEKAHQFQHDFVLPLAQQDPKIIGNGQFAYSMIHTTHDYVSVWGLLFYQRVPFVVLTGTRKRPAQ